MAYKRYVYKKGIRHGPYYYKNIRDETGKVKNVYLGKVGDRGKKPLKIVIVFLFLLLIIISILFFIQNRAIVLSKITAEESLVPFEIDQILIKVLVKSGESIEKELRVMNVGNDESDVMIEVVGLSDIVSVLDKEFTIKPGQTKIVRLNFSSFSEAKGIEQAPGVYIGKITAKTDSYETKVPLIVEIESKNVLFDMNLNPVARDRKINRGESITFEIRVFNLLDIESYNVDMEYFVKDINGNTIISESENVVVRTQASFFKTLKIPENLKLGNYVFIAQSSFGNSVGTASYLFEVESTVKDNIFTKFIGFCSNDPLCWALSIVVFLFIFTIGAYAYFFVGAYIYNKVFGLKIPKARELRLKQILELKKEGLKLKEEEENLKFKEEEENELLREERLEEKETIKEEKERTLKKFKGIIGSGHKALDRNKLKKADRIYSKLMDRYVKLPSEIKTDIFKEINSFYKTILEKHEILKRKVEKEKYSIEKLKEEEELEKKRKIQEKERIAKLREEKRRTRKKRTSEFLQGLGLVKTEKEKSLKEQERRKLFEEKRKQREIELRERTDEKRRQKALKIKIREEQLKFRNEIKKKREGKSGKFAKCHDLLLRAEHALERDIKDESHKFYIRARDVYIKLEYIEKKEIYEDIMKLYRKLKKHN